MKRNNSVGFKAALVGLAAACSLALVTSNATAAATFVINNVNAPGVGFNDTTPATPVGGNTGTTLGQQRLIAFTFAANTWAATLTSSVPIVIQAQFSALTCSATSAVLGSAGATQIFRDFPGAPIAGAWYSYALTNKLYGAEALDAPVAQINANFNTNLGLNANCLPGTTFYLGLDGDTGAAGSNIDFVAVLTHELGHGLGFQTFTSGATGVQQSGFPSVWDFFLYGSDANKLWKDMTNAERAASALSGDKLVWTGSIVNTALPGVLTLGTPGLTVTGAAAGAAAGSYLIGTASFGPAIATPSVTGQIMPVVDQSDGTGLACTALSAANTTAVRNNIALIDRGVCGFALKVKAAQDAGAIAVLIADNAVGTPPAGLGGADPTITIPAVRITQADGVKIKAQLNRRSRTASGVIATLGIIGSQYQGADALGRMKMYAPNPYISGSSVSHYDTSAFRNQLMEPNINSDLTHSVLPPQDLTFKLLQDIGW